MIDLSTAKKIFLYPGVTDMRLGILGLVRKVGSSLERECIYVFCGKNRKTNTLKSKFFYIVG